jgi:predicted CoA-substrate-specific enzyme activase
MATERPSCIVGLDVGSTTVKAVVSSVDEERIIWKRYQRHLTRQAETVVRFFERMIRDIGVPEPSIEVCVTGSGGAVIAEILGTRFVQEVHAVALAVEMLHPEAGSVVELGGQDAKIIIFKQGPRRGLTRKIPTMNDKCAGGTGAVIDKITAKLGIPAQEVAEYGFAGLKTHTVAGKCGVFAETDINSLQKLGIRREELMASLFEAIVQQNITVLLRGHTLRPEVLLLGGPNTFIRGMLECWQYHVAELWREGSYPIASDIDPESLVKVPENSLYFAAIGAVEYARRERAEVPRCLDMKKLRCSLARRRAAVNGSNGKGAFFRTPGDREWFERRYGRKSSPRRHFACGDVVHAYAGVDGGSTTTKVVLLNRQGDLLAKAYKVSGGNPIVDTVELFGRVRHEVESEGARLSILGVGTTGYAKDLLRDVLRADTALVETVAHTHGARHFYEDVEVICDVGGQDIKVIVLKNGTVKDFKLNTQCSAGNGYFLQSTAEGMGLDVSDYADAAFAAARCPEFRFGCAIFLQSDIVEFQRQGWQREEILAGLARVLPKNIWLYVCKMANLPKLGRRFVLQGGTQYNLAAVKAQVDYIEGRFREFGADRPIIRVHQHAGECGAIGAALESIRLHSQGKQTDFIGLHGVQSIRFSVHSDERTRCSFCRNHCARSFIDISADGGPEAVEFEATFESAIPRPLGTRRLIVGNACEKGAVEDPAAVQAIVRRSRAIRSGTPDLVAQEAKQAWSSYSPPVVADAPGKSTLLPRTRHRRRLLSNRHNLRIGMPRVLNLYSLAPFFTAYFESLGVPGSNLVFSDYTSARLYREGSTRGSIDPCFPSKVCIAHLHDLIFRKHEEEELDLIFFPMVYGLPSRYEGNMGSLACPTAMATPMSAKAAFIKEEDLFDRHGIRYLHPILNLENRTLAAKQVFREFSSLLGLSKSENWRAVKEGYAALEKHRQALQERGNRLLEDLEREDRIGVVVLARPYHGDPGLNHGILDDLRKRGYPILALGSLPSTGPIVERIFASDIEESYMRAPMDLDDVWKHSFSENTNLKLWGAKFVARHPNLVALELSNFKCGHDAPIYSTIEEIVERAGMPLFSFRDIDENKPAGAINIRIETIDYFLRQQQQALDGSSGSWSIAERRVAPLRLESISR